MKQLKISNVPNRGLERGEVQQPQPQAWLPAPMLGGEPLTDDASIRDYNGGIGCQVASALEETLLLPKDMVELRGLRRNEVFDLLTPSPNTPEDMGIQRKPQRSLQELLESQPGRGEGSEAHPTKTSSPSS